MNALFFCSDWILTKSTVGCCRFDLFFVASPSDEHAGIMTGVLIDVALEMDIKIEKFRFF